MFRTLCWSGLGAPNRQPSLCSIVLISRPSVVCGISVLAQHFWQLRHVGRNPPRLIPDSNFAADRRPQFAFMRVNRGKSNRTKRGNGAPCGSPKKNRNLNFGCLRGCVFGEQRHRTPVLGETAVMISDSSVAVGQCFGLSFVLSRSSSIRINL